MDDPSYRVPYGRFGNVIWSESFSAMISDEYLSPLFLASPPATKTIEAGGGGAVVVVDGST